jgi:hypothetical protein
MPVITKSIRQSELPVLFAGTCESRPAAFFGSPGAGPHLSGNRVNQELEESSVSAWSIGAVSWLDTGRTLKTFRARVLYKDACPALSWTEDGNP